jgi:hypothetical protein
VTFLFVIALVPVACQFTSPIQPSETTQHLAKDQRAAIESIAKAIGSLELRVGNDKAASEKRIAALEAETAARRKPVDDELKRIAEQSGWYPAEIAGLLGGGGGTG